ncbi:hypothetical protein [Virgisporangium aurantiacum]|uniref:Uncharacterized protein n=1 Tax=Virgisporangium aurantiacum TaxID=175570 RepID=A0A8J3ZGQ8_9ACTN|nr:hypothetical protein [Virgisporangium aurantiacum]GIJ61281.1 hypothetical protein Vau01_087970 [Virgisporangium aurantiacum]
MQNLIRVFAVAAATGAAVATTASPALAATVTRVPVDAAATGEISGVDPLSATDGWSVGGDGTNGVIRRFDGIRWRLVSSPNLADPSGGAGLSAVDAVSASTAFAVGSAFTAGAGNHAVAVRWNGSAWSRSTVGPTAFPNSRLVSVKAFSATDAWAVGTDERNTFDHTLVMHFDGTSWQQVAAPDPGTRNSFLTGVTGAAPTDVWAVGYVQNLPYGNRIRLPLVVHWNGTAWSEVPIAGTPTDTTTYLYGVSASSATDVWAVGYRPGAGSGAYVARWNGTTWNTVTAPAMGTLRSVSARAANDVWVTGYDANGAAVGHWNGSAWTVTPVTVTGGVGVPLVDTIAATGPGSAWLVGTQSDQTAGLYAPLAFTLTT